MSSAAKDDAILRAAERVARDGSVVVAYSNWAYRAMLLNWLIAIDRLEVRNLVLVALDEKIYDFLERRGFEPVSCPTPNKLEDIRTTRVRIPANLVRNGFSVVQSDIDAVWLRDPREEYFERSGSSLTISQGTYWPRPSYHAWGFVLCTGLYAIESTPSTIDLMDRWLTDIEITGSDQKSLNRLLLSDGVRWHRDRVTAREWRFRHRNMTTYEEVLSGDCAKAGLRIQLLPHSLFQRAPVEHPSPYVVHYLRDLASLPETRALTEHGSRFLRSDWRRTHFDATTLERIRVAPTTARDREDSTWIDPAIGKS